MASKIAEEFYKRHDDFTRRRDKRARLTKYHDKLKRQLEQLRDEDRLLDALALLKIVARKKDFAAMMKRKRRARRIVGEAAGIEQIQADWAASMPKISLAMLAFFSSILFGGDDQDDAPTSISTPRSM